MPFHLPLIRSCVLAMLAIASLSMPKAMAQVKIDRVPLPFDLTGAPVPTPPKPANEGAAAPATPPPAATTSSTLITGPVSHVYVYVEPYQIRVEALFDMHAVFKWLVPDEKQLPETLSPERQAQIVVDAEKLAADWCSLTTNEGRQPYIAPAASFVKGKPGATLPMQDKEELAFNQCMLGFVWQFTTNETPDQVEVMWKGWINDLKEMPVTILFGNQSEKVVVNSVTKRIQWMNKGRLRPSPLAAVPTFAPAEPVSVPLGAAIWIIAGLAFYWYIWHRDYRLPGGGLPYFGVWVFGLVLFSKILVITFQRGETVPVITQAAEAQKIVSPLLRNVYRAFDQRAESRVYDVLARSVDGELLRKLYLETITALTLDGREGTRVLITDFEATVDKVSPHPASGGFVAECNWSVLGNVGHWGHSHPRYNGYKARLTVQPMKGEWKLTGLDVQEVRRK
ncbi:MAG: hypothetical protein JNN17_23445 [Verrucomicrobiaceae bacterium]|nr:hypothetical protein [Verrucomicrobiaceae bacterium]